MNSPCKPHESTVGVHESTVGIHESTMEAPWTYDEKHKQHGSNMKVPGKSLKHHAGIHGGTMLHHDSTNHAKDHNGTKGLHERVMEEPWKPHESADRTHMKIQAKA